MHLLGLIIPWLCVSANLLLRKWFWTSVWERKSPYLSMSIPTPPQIIDSFWRKQNKRNGFVYREIHQ